MAKSKAQKHAGKVCDLFSDIQEIIVNEKKS